MTFFYSVSFVASTFLSELVVSLKLVAALKFEVSIIKSQMN